MESESDILKKIPVDDLPLLKDYYSHHLPYASQAYNFFNTAIKWMTAIPEKHLFKLFAPGGDWKSDGTFIALFEFSCYDIFLFTMDPKCERLYESLVKTKRFDFKNNLASFFSLHIDHRDAVVKALNKLGVPIDLQFECYTYWMPKEEAAELSFTCPDEYYIEALRPEHAAIIDKEWPHHYKGSVDYIATNIEMNGGHGVFTKDGKLVSWILNVLGSLAILQTLDEYKRKGLGSLLSKLLSKEIGSEGSDLTTNVLIRNKASRAMFSKLGFKILNGCVFLYAGNREKRWY